MYFIHINSTPFIIAQIYNIDLKVLKILLFFHTNKIKQIDKI